MNRRHACLLAAALAGLGGQTGLAQTYPNGPVHLVVPYPPGGTTDFTARLIQNTLGGLLGQPILVENRGGATGAIGAEYVARARPDGQIIMFTPVTDMILRQFVMKANPVHVIRDFTPLGAVMQTFSVITAHPAVPVNSAKELFDYARQNPGKLTYGTPGYGSYFHLGGELLKLNGVTLLHVPYKGGGPVVAAVTGGEINLAINDLTTMLPFIRERRMKALAVLDDQRLPVLPEVPVVKEYLPGFEMPEGWFGFFGPAALPGPIVTRLNADIVKTFGAPEVRPKIEERNVRIISGTPQEMARGLVRAMATFEKVVKAAGIQPE